MRSLDRQSGYHPYRKRTEDAIAFRGIKTVQQLLTELNRRGTGRQVGGVFISMQNLLEPPFCRMPHCEHHTKMEFCNCSLGYVPDRCSKHRAYLKRWRLRQAKAPAQQTRPKETDQ